MHEKISESFIKKLLEIISITEIISSKISLKKSGKYFTAICPFHIEKSPSFVVNEKKQFYYCFGCKTYGNAINFIMKYEKLGFLESIKELSSFYGIKIPKKKIKNIFDKKKTDFFAVNEYMKNFYNQQMHNSTVNLLYSFLKKRQINSSSIKKYCIGFSSSILSYLNRNTKNKKNFFSELKKLNFLHCNKNGKVFDFFRNRIMFPIRNSLGFTIGFGGRALNNAVPKYLNSIENKFFKKRKILYGIYEIKKKKSIA
ncbi:CHC2 zinc finger domain-containing protein [bacterium endosymbiont of Pedicinus badii]|uniref:CHC2 zinc finger domain-containing protein n=1 Tax=bacterium endosymbiont of Pedicinus badii TaxID=1719126 RepID=UPI0009BA344F|nr:CHC2 zinc finger domain-containing protein [bacterium endosymbiont of Pedicinus badii]OQM34157.1 hypothetical protein AOQ89_02350 [bacterium endosymbiont of Pedicinus badii]